MKPLYFTAMLFLFAFASFLPAQQPGAALWEKRVKASSDWIEPIADYNSYINWSAGEVQSEVEVPIGTPKPNVGKYLNNVYNDVRDELRQNLIKAMGYVRISDIFQLKEYYSIKSDVRYEIISHADRAYYYPTIQTEKGFFGRAKLNLYGKDGIANIFYRDIERASLEKYVKETTKNMESFDGLILDTTYYPEYNPSIQMRIYDEDNLLLYGPETVEKEHLAEKGVCEYTTSLTHAFNSPRSGNHVFYTIPYDVIGRMKTYFRMKNSDAARLFENPRTVKALNQSQVIVVKPPMP